MLAENHYRLGILFNLLLQFTININRNGCQFTFSEQFFKDFKINVSKHLCCLENLYTKDKFYPL